MIMLLRLFCATGLVLSVFAVERNINFLQGDRIVYEATSKVYGTTLNEVRYQEVVVRRGLLLHPRAWEPILRHAEYLARQGEIDPRRYEDALETLEQSFKLYRGIQGLLLEAKIYYEMGRHEEAIAAFESLRRVSPIDRSIAQYLIRLYRETEDYEKLKAIGEQIHLSWPTSFDALMSLGLGTYYHDSDLLSAFKYFLLAYNSPETIDGRPTPHAFEAADAQRLVGEARVLLRSQRLYEAPWATMPPGPREFGQGAPDE